MSTLRLIIYSSGYYFFIFNDFDEWRVFPESFLKTLYTLLIAGVQSIRTWRCRVQSTFTKSNCIVPNDTQLKRNRHTLSLPTSHYKIANITRDVCPLACIRAPKRKWSLERRISFSSTISLPQNIFPKSAPRLKARYPIPFYQNTYIKMLGADFRYIFKTEVRKWGRTSIWKRTLSILDKKNGLECSQSPHQQHEIA